MKTLTLILITLAPLANANQAVITSINKAADLVGIPRPILRAVCTVESSLRTTASITHTDGSSLSIGLCQIKLQTAQWIDRVYKHQHLATLKSLSNPYVNSLYAAKYLRLQYLRYHGNWSKACTAYNKGSADNGVGRYWAKVQKELK